MKFSKYIAFAIFSIFSFQPDTAAQAQGFTIGPEVGLNLDGGNLFLGVNATKDFEVSGYDIIGNAVADYYFVDGFSAIGFEFTALYRLADQESFSPYVGGGLSILSFSFDNELAGLDLGFTNTGLMAKGGANFAPMGSMIPFAEAALYFTGSDIVISGGVRFSLGGE